MKSHLLKSRLPSLVVMLLTLSFSLIAQSNDTPDKQVSIDAAWDHFKQQEYALAETMASSLLLDARNTQDLNQEYDALNVLLAVRYTQNRYSHELLKYEYRMEEIAIELGDKNKLASASNNLGYDLLTTGQAPLPELIPRLERANKLYAELEQHNGRWYTLMNLTWAYRAAGDLPKSEQAGLKAVARSEEINDRHAIIETKLNLAETLIKMDKKDASDTLVEEARAAAGTEQDRDRHVFEVYSAQHLLDSGKDNIDTDNLLQAINALENQEIFYEMLGRAVLSEILFKAGNSDAASEEATKVVSARDNFVPREAIRRAEGVMARIARQGS